MTIDERLHTLNTLSTARLKELVDGYTRIANDFRVDRDDRHRARRRLKLLRMAQLPSWRGRETVWVD